MELSLYDNFNDVVRKHEELNLDSKSFLYELFDDLWKSSVRLGKKRQFSETEEFQLSFREAVLKEFDLLNYCSLELKLLHRLHMFTSPEQYFEFLTKKFNIRKIVCGGSVSLHSLRFFVLYDVFIKGREFIESVRHRLMRRLQSVERNKYMKIVKRESLKAGHLNNFVKDSLQDENTETNDDISESVEILTCLRGSNELYVPLF